MRVLGILLLPALLIGCATVSSASRDGGFIRHGAAVSENRVQKMAEQECASFGKEARLRDTEYVSIEGVRTRYDCVE